MMVKQMIKVKYISLVNLILDKLLVNEFIQHELTPVKLAVELTQLMENNDRKKQLRNGYAELRQKLGGTGASERAAGLIYAQFA